MTAQPALRRDRSAARLGGVCAALAQTWGVDPKLVRIAAVVVTVLTNGLAVAGYLALWLLIPQKGSDDLPARRWLPFARNWSDTQLVIAVAVASVLFTALITGAAPGGLVVVMVGWLIIMFGSRRPAHPTEVATPSAHRQPPRTEFERLARAWEIRMDSVYTGVDAPPTPFAASTSPSVPQQHGRRAGSVWFGVLAGFGAVWAALAIADRGGAPVPTLAYTSGFLAVLGIALLASARRRRRPFGLATATVILGLITALLLSGGQLMSGVVPAPTTLTYATVSELPGSLELGFGPTKLDLRNVEISADRTVSYAADVGQLTVLLPESGNVIVNSAVDMGQIDHRGENHSGIDLTASYRRVLDPNAPSLTINLALDVGRIAVRP